MTRPKFVALIALLSVVLVGCAGSKQVSPYGYLGVEVGMSVSEANEKSALNLSAGHNLNEDDLNCHFVSPSGAASPYGFMVVEGRITRVDIWQGGIYTATGLGVGSSESEVLKAYPNQVEVSPHRYTDGHYLTVSIADGYAIIFETDGSEVERYRAGSYPSIAWIEGCL
ncbi:MAG: hypothetical protein MUP90_01840 [Gammaproteobacteria bacterium]|nr:hypothetical protein [Gammaproteobacteria bacterium]